MKYIPALLADWANGLFAVLLAAGITNTEIAWWHFLVGIAFAHVPDIDALPELFTRGRVSASAEHVADHRTLLHYPVLAIILGTGAVAFFGYWGWILAIALALHLLNDLYGTGWGIPIFWPLANRSYKLLGRRVNRLKSILVQAGDWETIPLRERRLRFLVSWSEEERPDYINRWGVDDWVSLWYYRLNWVSGIEYGLFFIACIATYLVLAN